MASQDKQSKPISIAHFYRARALKKKTTSAKAGKSRTVLSYSISVGAVRVHSPLASRSGQHD